MCGALVCTYDAFFRSNFYTHVQYPVLVGMSKDLINAIIIFLDLPPTVTPSYHNS
jgi:hypothetical protein